MLKTFVSGVTDECKRHLLFRASTLSSAVSSLANTGMSLTRVDERERQAALEEEQARLKALKVRPPPSSPSHPTQGS